jgi:hypothetical protein
MLGARPEIIDTISPPIHPGHALTNILRKIRLFVAEWISVVGSSVKSLTAPRSWHFRKRTKLPLNTKYGFAFFGRTLV